MVSILKSFTRSYISPAEKLLKKALQKKDINAITAAFKKLRREPVKETFSILYDTDFEAAIIKSTEKKIKSEVEKALKPKK